MIKSFLKKIIPLKIFSIYHWFLAYFATLFYGWPSEKMIVIGVTGTAGKSTAVNLIGKILEQAGFKVGLSTTFNFKIGDQEWENKKKMTMLGRFALQKFLKKMFQSGCRYAIIETSSEGIKQFRHLGINYDVAVFLNLFPEHLESHGGFEKYRQAKEKLFFHLAKKRKKIINGKLIEKISIVNFDDQSKEYFLKFPADQKYGFTIINQENRDDLNLIKADGVLLNSNQTSFKVKEIDFKLNLLGEFNIYNALSAISVALSQNIPLEICAQALKQVESMPGRMEIILKNPFTVIVDYAHLPDSLEKVYQTLKPLVNRKMICVLGSAGGGRDKWKRPVMGALAEKYGDEIIVTNEDPYDENSQKIIDEIIHGIKSKKVIKILDRKEAIEKALRMAEPGDLVIITGKGCEPWLMGPKGEKIPWDDRKIVKDFLKKM